MRFHILRLQIVILGRWMVVIPPHTGLPIRINARSVWKAVFLRAIQHFGHEGPRIVKNGVCLDPVSLYA